MSTSTEPEPSTRRLRQYFVLAVLTLVVVASAIWGMWAAHQTDHRAQANARVADRLCKQLLGLGQPCVAQPTEQGQSAAAIIPAAPVSPGSYTPLPPAPGATRSGGGTDPGSGNAAQAFAPGPGALIVAVGVERGVLVLTYDDGARVAAGQVDVAQLSIVLRASPIVTVSPSPSPSPVPASSSTSQPAPPAGTPVPEETPS